MNRAIRVFAAVTLALVVLDMLFDRPDSVLRQGAIGLAEQLLRQMFSFSAYLVGFTTGVVALVSSAQLRRWPWLVLLLPVVILSAYAPFVGPSLLFAVAGSDGFTRVTSLVDFATLQFMLELTASALTALVSFIYALRAYPRVAVPDLDLEVSSIEEPDPIL